MYSAEEVKKAIQGNGTARKHEEFLQFYKVEWDKDGNQIRRVKIRFSKLVELLKHLGFCRYDVGNESHIIRMVDNVVQECQKAHVIDEFEDYLYSFGENLPEGVMTDMLIDRIYANLGTYFSDNLLTRMRPDRPIKLNEHTKNKAFFYYQNGYVEVTADGLQLKKYHTLKNAIWDNQILERPFRKVPLEEYKDHPFVRFCRNIANDWEERPDKRKKNTASTPERFRRFQQIIGYMLHAYFDGDLKAIIFTDSRISDDPSGRSGKTLLLKAIGRILNKETHSRTFIELNGKDFDLKDRFKYQELGLDTKLIHINDVNRNFDFTGLFNDITEGIKRQRKNEAPIPVFAKMAVSTNRTIRIHGPSSKGRSVEVEMADYYDDEWTPAKEFNHWFFRDWAPSDWAAFDNFMMECVQMYLRHGLERPDAINLQDRKMIEETAPEFCQWMEMKNPKHLEEWDKKDALHEFKELYGDGVKSDFHWLTQRKFTEWLRLYVQYHPDFDELEERRSNSSNFSKFVRSEKWIGENDFTGEKIPF